jgi:aryl-alcohol dehydrogenase-like predicted oxidoreductase
MQGGDLGRASQPSLLAARGQDSGDRHQQLFADTDADVRMFRADAQLDAVQPPYNLFGREIDVDVLPYAEDTGLTVLSYGALCRGLLSGRMTADTKFAGE